MDDLLSQFKVMAIAAHCLHTGMAVEKTSFDDVQECTYGFCRTRYRLYSEAVQEAGPESPREPMDYKAEFERLTKLIDIPHTKNFLDAVSLEAAHQVKRWSTEHDAGKEPQDWFWLVGYLAGKALRAAIDGDIEKAKHHTISTAAVMRNWHRRLSGEGSTFQPGTDLAL